MMPSLTVYMNSIAEQQQEKKKYSSNSVGEWKTPYSFVSQPAAGTYKKDTHIRGVEWIVCSQRVIDFCREYIFTMENGGSPYSTNDRHSAVVVKHSKRPWIWGFFCSSRKIRMLFGFVFARSRVLLLIRHYMGCILKEYTRLTFGCVCMSYDSMNK